MPNLARLHGCSHSCDALPCFSPGANYTSFQCHPLTWVSPGHPSQGHAHPTHLLPSACAKILPVTCSFSCLSVRLPVFVGGWPFLKFSWGEGLQLEEAVGFSSHPSFLLSMEN